LSCEKREKSNDPLEISKERIDRQEYDQAEADLKYLIQKDPENQAARALLASVYLGRAGVTVRHYFRLKTVYEDQGIFDDTKIPELENILNLKGVEHSEPLILALAHLGSLARETLGISMRFEKIPALGDGQYEQVEMALQQLQPIVHPAPSVALYRGAIRTLLLKARWNRGLYLRFGNHQLCQSSIAELKIRTENLQEFVSQLLLDLAMGMPNSRTDLLQKNQRWQASGNELQRNLKSIAENGETILKVLQFISKKSESNSILRDFKCDF
jgi:hypothetical protein